MVKTTSDNMKVNPGYIVCLLLVVLILAAYFPIMGNGFINHDDPDYVTENYVVRQGLTLNGIKWAFTSLHAANWHPITWLSHMLDCQIYGLDAGKHHATSLIFHIINSILLFYIFFRSTEKLWHSTFVAIFFALHPMHVESVAWVAERKDVLSTFFMLITFMLYISYARSGKKTAYWTSVIFFAIGLMSKPMLVTLPFLFLLFDYWPLGRFSDINKNMGISVLKSKIGLVKEKTPFFVLTFISCLITLIAQKEGGAVMSLGKNPLMVRFLHVSISYVDYIKKMFLPIKLAVHYPHPVAVSLDRFYVSFFILIIISSIVIFFFKKKPYLFTGWFWFIGTLVPVIGIVQVGGQAIADRYTYIPFTGLFVMLIWGLYDLVQANQVWKKVVTFILAAVTLCFIPLTNSQAALWVDTITLFNDALKNTKNNFLAHINIGNAMIGIKGIPIENAMEHFEKAIAIDHGLSIAYTSMGTCYQLKNENEKAIANFNKAIKLDPVAETAFFNLGILNMNIGVYDESIKFFDKALEINKYNAQAYNGLGAVFAKKGDRDKALIYFQKAYELGFKQADKNIKDMLQSKAN